MKKLLTFAKGKLTNLSLGTILVDVLLNKEQIIDTYTVAQNTDVTVVSLVGLVGTILGIVRKFTKAYKEN